MLVACVAEMLLGRFVLLDWCTGPFSFTGAVLLSLAVFLGVVGLLDRTAIREIMSLIKSNVPKAKTA